MALNSTAPNISQAASMASNISLGTSNLTLELLESDIEELRKDMNDLFVAFCAILTSFMQVGFASLEAGCVNSKNVTNIILKNVLDTFICAIFYWLVGYSLAYSPGNALFGYTGWAGMNLPPDKRTFWMFEFVFASTASTILSGSVAERCSFVTYMAYSSIISGFVYPVASHWAWGENGWLKALNYYDFAGCGVVHALGGSSALVAAALLGPRIGRFKDGEVVEKPGHSMSLVGLGGLLLISGFLGFNAGALGKIVGEGARLGKVLQNTIMGGAGAAAAILILCRLGVVGQPTWAFSITLNAVLAGLVAVCGAVNKYTPFMSLIIGSCGCLAFLSVRHLVLRYKVDDPLDAVAVHFGGGFLGVIAIPIFSPEGLIYGINAQNAQQLVSNLVGGTAIVLWATACSFVLFGTLKITNLLRVSEEEEIQGLDVSKHKEPAYPVEGWVSDYPVQMQANNGLKKSGSYTLNRTDEGEFIMIGPQVVQLSADTLKP